REQRAPLRARSVSVHETRGLLAPRRLTCRRIDARGPRATRPGAHIQWSVALATVAAVCTSLPEGDPAATSQPSRRAHLARPLARAVTLVPGPPVPGRERGAHGAAARGTWSVAEGARA